MKIDIIRKAPKIWMQSIIFLEENGALDKVELLPQNIAQSAPGLLQERRFQVRLRGYKKFFLVNGNQRQNIILLGAGNKNELNNNKVRNLFCLYLFK